MIIILIVIETRNKNMNKGMLTKRSNLNSRNDQLFTFCDLNECMYNMPMCRAASRRPDGFRLMCPALTVPVECFPLYDFAHYCKPTRASECDCFSASACAL